MVASAFVALILASIFWCSKAQLKDWTLYFQDEISTMNRSVDAIDDEASATILLQTQMLLSADLQNGLVTSYVPPKLLILILSCHEHASNWPTLYAWGEKVHPGGKVIVLLGKRVEEELPWAHDEAFYFDDSMKQIVVNASDAYEALPVRMLTSFHTILSSAEFADITHVLKIDDTTILGTYDISKPDGMNATSIELALSKSPADYLAPEFGYRAYDCNNSPPKDAFTFHWKYSSSTSYWFNRAQPCDGTFTYADGEFGYILSRHALRVLVQHWPLQRMDDLYHNYVYEDLAIGQTLFNHSVTLLPVSSLQGMPHLASLRCPCNAAAPNALCDSYCTNSDNEGTGGYPHARCCWQACGSFPGLCRAAIDI